MRVYPTFAAQSPPFETGLVNSRLSMLLFDNFLHKERMYVIKIARLGHAIIVLPIGKRTPHLPAGVAEVEELSHMGWTKLLYVSACHITLFGA